MVKKREVGGKALMVLPENGYGGLRFSFRYYALTAAFSYAYNPIFVLADNYIDREALDVHEVKGLGIGKSMTDKGFCLENWTY